MAVYPTQKAERLAQSLIDELAITAATATIAKSYDTGIGAIILTITSNAHLSYVLIKQVAAPASGVADGLGLTQNVYTPHVIRFEYNTTDAFAAVGFEILAACLSKGSQVDYHQALAPAASAADLKDATLANFVASYKPSTAELGGWGSMPTI